MNYTFSKKIGMSLAVLALAFFIAQTAFAQVWTGPTASFPNDNTDAPIHTGDGAQGKISVGFSSSFPKSVRMDDLFSRFSTYSEGVVAAPKFCLTPTFTDYSNAIDTDPTNDDCITSWGGVVGGSLPDGLNTETLRHNGTEWVSNNILQNDGVTVTVMRGAGLPSTIGGGAIDGSGTIGVEGATGGGNVITNPGSSPLEEIGGGVSGFNYIQDLFATKQAFAQNNSSSAPIFRAIKAQTSQQGGGVYGLEVLHNGLTRAKGGFISQGDATVSGETELQDLTTVHRIKIQDMGTTNTPGGVLEAWDGEFQWNGGGGNFHVGAPARFTRSLLFNGGPPNSVTPGHVLTASSNTGQAAWQPAKENTKVCVSRSISDGKHRDSLIVPDSWTHDDCRGYVDGFGSMKYQLGCMQERGLSLGAPADSATETAGLPSNNNCGWSDSGTSIYMRIPFSLAGEAGQSCRDVLENYYGPMSSGDIFAADTFGTVGPYTSIPSWGHVNKCHYWDQESNDEDWWGLQAVEYDWEDELPGKVVRLGTEYFETPIWIRQ